MSRRAVPKANPAVRSTQGCPVSRRAVPKANPAVRSTQGCPVSRRAVPKANPAVRHGLDTVARCRARMEP
jgi:hypothetical protein